MDFNFNPPPKGTATPAAAPAPAPAQGNGAAGAFAGFGDAKIDVRDPTLPLGCAALVSLVDTAGKQGYNTGFGIYIRVRIEQIAAAGGVASPEPQIRNLNMAPLREGAIHTIAIRGFDKDKSQAFAFSELKQFLIAALESKGLTAETAAQLPGEQWEKMAHAVAAGQLDAEGARFAVQTTHVGSQAGFGKLKVQCVPLSVAMPQGSADAG